MTPTISKIIWLAFGIAWFVLRSSRAGGARARRRCAIRGAAFANIVLLAASLTGLGIVPVVYVAVHFPRFADYPFVPVLSYLGIAVDVACLWLFHRTHRDLGHNWSVSLDRA